MNTNQKELKQLLDKYKDKDKAVKIESVEELLPVVQSINYRGAIDPMALPLMNPSRGDSFSVAKDDIANNWTVGDHIVYNGSRFVHIPPVRQSAYIHYQDIPSSVWYVTPCLGIAVDRLYIQVRDFEECDIMFNPAFDLINNRIMLNFPLPVAGRARLHG